MTFDATATGIVLREITYDEAVPLHKMWHGLSTEIPSLLATYLEGAQMGDHKICFACEIDKKPVAVMIFGGPCNPEVTELRGFAIAPHAPKNTGSYSMMLAAKRIKALWPECEKMRTYSLPGRYKMSLYKGSSFYVLGDRETMSGLKLVELERRL